MLIPVTRNSNLLTEREREKEREREREGGERDADHC